MSVLVLPEVALSCCLDVEEDWSPATLHSTGTACSLQDDSSQGNIPTAVNLPLTCRIIITVITSARMCIALAAIWKMMVFASSIFRA